MKGRKSKQTSGLYRMGLLKGLVWSAGFYVTLAAGTSLAATLTALQWVPLSSSSVEAAKVQLVQGSNTGLTILVTTPGFSPGVHEDGNGRFATLSLPDEGLLQESGKPALPVIRRLIVVPDEAEISCSFSGTPLTTSLVKLGVPSQVRPVQPPVPKIPGAVEAAVFAKDSALYSSPEIFPVSPVTLSEAGTLFGRRLFTLEVCPLVVIPSTGGLMVYSNMTITVTFNTGSVRVAEIGMTGRERALLQGMVLNPPPPVATITATQKRLLIIVPDNFIAGLTSFKSHKISRGWIVDCYGTSSAGTTTNTIQGFIRNRYTNSATRPDALLLVGDVAQIPCFRGYCTDNPDTDLYYGCMDGAGDWQPEFPVGRLSVSTTNQLAVVLDKSIAYEQVALAPWIKRATFMASLDNYSVSEGTHNTVITTTFNHLGFASQKLYCKTFSATTAQARKAFNNGCAMGIYSGHGDTTYWADGPSFRSSDVNGLTNAAHYPVVCSFACLTGQYSIDECFAETWLRAPGKGAAGILASSVTSYWDEDDILEKSFCKAVFDENQPLLGAAIWRAKQLYLAIYGTSTTTTRRYFEQYNLLGDPTLELVGIPALTNGIPVAWFTSQGITNTDYNLELQADRDGDGLTAQQEYLAGTNPGDASSALRMVTEGVANGRISLSWLSADTLLSPVPPYQVWYRTNLTKGIWMPQTNLYLRTPPTNTVQLSIPLNSPQLFFRVSLTN